MGDRGRVILARLERIPVWPYDAGLMVVLGVAWFFAYFDIGTIADALPVAVKTYHASLAVGLSAVSAGLFGYIVGELVDSAISDLRGRRLGLIVGTALYALGALVNGLSPNMGLFIAARFVSGAGIGAIIGVNSTYLGEIIPSRVRGRFAAWTTMPALVGLGAVPFIALAIVPTTAVGWRVLLMLPVLGVLPLLISGRSVPESPRWLIEHGRVDEAEAIVSAAEARVERRIGALPPVSDTLVAELEPAPAERLTLGSILRPPFLGITLILFFVWFFNYLTVYGFQGDGVPILVSRGYSLTTSIQLTLGGAVGGVVGALISPQISDIWARKWPPFVVTLAVAICYIILGLSPSNILIALAFTLLNFQVGIFAPMVYYLTAEHFPTAGRNLGVAITDGVGHLGGAIGPLLGLTVYQALGFGAMWAMFGVGFFLTCLFLLFTRNTTRRTLEVIVQDEMGASRLSH